VALTNTDRLHTRLLAIDIRLHELSQELQRTQVQVNHLEAQLEDARLARMVGGDEAGDAASIGSELEASRNRLESQRELVESVKKNQWNARVQYTLARVKERQEARNQADPQ